MQDAAALVGFVFAVQIVWKIAELCLSIYIFLAVDIFLLNETFPFDLRVLCLHERNDSLAHPKRCAQIGVDVCLPLICGSHIFHSSVTSGEEGTRNAYTVRSLPFLTTIGASLRYLHCSPEHRFCHRRNLQLSIQQHVSPLGFEGLLLHVRPVEHTPTNA